MNKTDGISRIEFIRILLGGTIDKSYDDELTEAIDKALKEGIISSEDILFGDNNLRRMDCARIIHEYMRKRLNVPDIISLDEAYKLKDIYDCHVCTNHIAQVYVRGIMECKNNGVFDLAGLVKYDDVQKYINRINL